ncbi:A-kinase anchor protein SPHKAP [Manis javanica]|nr:A-kinase anchor protein SPHKAP [Manis javanica]
MYLPDQSSRKAHMTVTGGENVETKAKNKKPHTESLRSRPGPDRGLSSQAHSTSAEKHAAKPPDGGSWLHLKERTFSDGNPGPETCLPSDSTASTPQLAASEQPQGSHFSKIR